MPVTAAMTEPTTGRDLETTTHFSDRIPLRPTSPDQIQKEQDLLAELQEAVAQLELDGWVVSNVTTSESPATGTYLRWYTLTRERR